MIGSIQVHLSYLSYCNIVLISIEEPTSWKIKCSLNRILSKTSYWARIEVADIHSYNPAFQPAKHMQTNTYRWFKRLNIELTFLLFSWSHLSQVAVVISFHFQIEDFAICFFGLGNEKLFQKFLWQKTNRHSKLLEKSSLILNTMDQL